MKRKYIVGVDLGGTNIKIGLIRNNKILAKSVSPTPKFSSPARLIGVIISGIRQIFPAGAGYSLNGILGVGLGVPGPVDFVRGVVYYLPNINGWHNVRLAEIIRKELKRPVFVDNDANLMCLAESRLGAAWGKKNVVAITLGTGVGGGLLINGELYRGSGFLAGEIGHIPINEDGPRCNCGSSACLERYIGNRYILRDAKKVFKRNVSLESLSEMARRGNPRAVRIWEDMSRHLGIALAGVVNLLNPEVIVIGGGVSAAGKAIFDSVRKIIRERAMPVQARSVRVLRAQLANDAGILGAGLLVREEIK